MTTPPRHDLETTEYRVDDLQPYHENPRRGDVDTIAESLRVNGQYRPIVVNKGTRTGRDMEILAGNHTYLAARQLGWDMIACTVVDVDETAAARIVLADNRTSDLAGFDTEQLAALLQSLDDLEGSGYTEKDLAALTPYDDTPPDADPITKPGDVWQLGPHRVMCGDSTRHDHAGKLFGDDRADAIWTDPPYGVSYVGKTADALTIQNDGAADVEPIVTGAFEVAAAHARPGSAVYATVPPGPDNARFVNMFGAVFDHRQNLVWVKNTFVLGHSDYHYRHEPILYGFTRGGDGRLGRGGPRWYGGNSQTTVFETQTTVFEVDKPAANRHHPTMKPVELVRAMLQNSAKHGDIVYDPFGGSGSTLLAAHSIGAHARLMELDPRYVDVICRRFEEATGQRPTRNGEPYSFT